MIYLNIAVTMLVMLVMAGSAVGKGEVKQLQKRSCISSVHNGILSLGLKLILLVKFHVFPRLKPNTGFLPFV